MSINRSMSIIRYLIPLILLGTILPAFGQSSSDISINFEFVLSPANDPADLSRETQLVENSKSNSVVFGVTILKRLVPGWFVRADIGSDVIAFGVALEF